MSTQQSGPRPGDAGAAQGELFHTRDSIPQSAESQSESVPRAETGAELRDAALAALEVPRPSRVRAAQAALLRLLLARGRATIDEVRAALALPDGEPARWLGAVPGALAREGIIAHDGYELTRRAVAHARPLSAWRLRDRAAAETWLARRMAAESAP